MAPNLPAISPILTDRSTHRRVQEALHELVKEHKVAIEYAALLVKVRPVVLRSTASQYSDFRNNIRRSVMRLQQLGHITLQLNVAPPLICLTRAGKQFYTRFSPPPRARAGRARKLPRQAPKAQAIAEYLRWATPLLRIQEIVAEKALNPQDKCPVKHLSATVRSYMETAEALRSHNSDLSIRINDLSWELDQVDPGNHAGDDADS